MGTLDWLKELENRTLDAATFNLLKRNYEMQEENCRLLKEKAEFLGPEVKRLGKEVARLQTENAELRRCLESSVREQDFDIQDGIAFMRSGEDDYDETPYCPTCKVVMSTSTGRSFLCPKCKYARATQVPVKGLLARLKQRR